MQHVVQKYPRGGDKHGRTPKVEQNASKGSKRYMTTRAKQSKSLRKTLRSRPEVRETRAESFRKQWKCPAIRDKIIRTRKATSNERIRTKWRHAMRDPLFLAWREKVEVLPPEGNTNQSRIDRLREIDEINKRGTIEQKRRCLKDFLCNSRRGILPRFYSSNRFKEGVRYPGDGGPDP
jgi:hypothetical protein